ncbi:hypothetical protein LXT21_22060 [Myxococcus sp. K38C18041901]|uniref:hypothetical protein n=1 Tax=Myxococcus guangdongensis TaxID=2906760 RepID=UPI0020A7FB68|nr:hypothetical protein [Myxococcus guangdongensis]MCP3061473.1 hypothetical protein [Myxococcus guangdongensis]
MSSRLTFFALLSLLGACSDSEESCRRGGVGTYSQPSFAAPNIEARRVDCGFQSSVSDVALGEDGLAWIRRGEYVDRGEDTFFFPPSKFLSKLDPMGNWLGEFPLPDFVTHHVVHPSGEVTVFGWEKDADPRVIQVRRLRRDGSLVAQRRFTQDIPPAERLDFIAQPDGAVTRVRTLESERSAAILLARADGEEVVFLGAIDGMRVGRLDASLETSWLSPVAPTVALKDFSTGEQMAAVGAPWVGWGLDVDERHQVHVATPLMDLQRRAYVESFEREPTGATGRAFLLSSFSPTGAFVSARAVSAPKPQEIVGLVVRAGAFALGASERARVGGRALSPDLYFASGRLEGPVEDDLVRTLDVDRDDVPVSFVPCGRERYCFAGDTGFEQGSTDLEQRKSKGFLLEVDPLGQQVGLFQIQYGEGVHVLVAREGRWDKPVFAFSLDGSQTPGGAGSRAKSNQTWVGILSPL